MGTIAKMKQMGGFRPFDAAASIPTIAPDVDELGVGPLTIPDTGTMFYVSMNDSSLTYELTSVLGKQQTGREVVLLNKTMNDEFVIDTTAVAQFPGATGQVFGPATSIDLVPGANVTLKMLETGAWMKIAETAIS